MRIKSSMCLGLVLATVVPSFAGGAGGFGGFGAFGGGGGARTLLRPDVAADLKLSDEQKSKAQALVESQGASMRELFQSLQNASQDERARKMQEVQAENTKQINAILTPDQQKRYAQLSLQIEGLSAVARPDLSQKLKITDDQRQKIQSIQMERFAAMRELLPTLQNASQEERTRKMQELSKKTDEKIAAILTDDQKKQWKDMTGEPLKTV